VVLPRFGMSGERVTLSMDEAMAVVAAPGQTFEVSMSSVTVSPTENSRTLREPAPVSTRLGRRPDFLVYEDEEWSLTPSCVKWTLWLRPGAPLRDKAGDRVGIAMRNLPEWIVSFAASFRWRGSRCRSRVWTEDELDYAINDSGAKVLIATPSGSRAPKHRARAPA